MVNEGLARRIADGRAVVGGVLSGTSADGVDVALARFAVEDGDLRLVEVVAGATRPFPPALATAVRDALDGAPVDLRGAALLGRDLGRAFGEAAAELAREAGAPLDVLGSHGQTVYHHDDVEPSGPATLQLGDGCHVAEAAGCPVVSDLRHRDVAAGGGGAPLSAYGDEVLFRMRPLAVLNLGGMANLTWLPSSGPSLAFDTGPAGALLDGLARRVLGRPLDEGGEAARGGRPDPARVEAALAHPFFAAAPPKSTGRDTFGEAWVDQLGWGGEAADVLATGVEVVARSVADAARRFLPESPRELCVAGGGLHHGPLRAALQEHLGCPVVSSLDHGVDPDLREALVFGALAARFVLGVPSTVPGATGAAPGRTLGKWSPGTR